MDQDKWIPFNKPYIIGKELEYITRAIQDYGHISGNGPFTERCQQQLEQALGCQRAFLTHSCTAALEMAAILCGIQPGDEVIMPSFTFVSTANAFVLRGGVPVFIDIRPDTLNMDENRIEEAVTPKTKAIVPVHYAGVPCAMDDILSIAEENDLRVIEDAAQAYLSRHRGRPLGTLGHLGCLSFHETKNIISGEGGALLVNDEQFRERAEIIWEKGTDRIPFLNGDVDKYSWQDIGSSYLPSEMVGAFLYAQLERADAIIAKRSRLFSQYFDELKNLEDQGRLGLPCLHKEIEGTGHMFFIVAASADEGRCLIQYLRARNIDAITHYTPLHSSKAGMKYGRVSGSMQNTDGISRRVIRLPLFYGMEASDVARVAKTIQEFFN